MEHMGLVLDNLFSTLHLDLDTVINLKMSDRYEIEKK